MSTKHVDSVNTAGCSGYSRPRRKALVFTAVSLTLIIAYQLLSIAQQTGNFEGMWFSLAHTVLVAVATVLALL